MTEITNWKLTIIPPTPLTRESVEGSICALKRLLLGTGEDIHSFVHILLETAYDGTIELYEFIDLVLLLHILPQPLDRDHLCSRMKVIRATGGMERPWTYDDDGQCSMPNVYALIRSIFQSLGQELHVSGGSAL